MICCVCGKEGSPADERRCLVQEVERLKVAHPGTPAMFPIQDGPGVPWEVMAPHEVQCRKNHQQSLSELARRGGLGSAEAWAVVNGISLWDLEKDFEGAKKKWREFATEPHRLREMLRGWRSFAKLDCQELGGPGVCGDCTHCRLARDTELELRTSPGARVDVRPDHVPTTPAPRQIDIPFNTTIRWKGGLRTITFSVRETDEVWVNPDFRQDVRIANLQREAAEVELGRCQLAKDEVTAELKQALAKLLTQPEIPSPDSKSVAAEAGPAYFGPVVSIQCGNHEVMITYPNAAVAGQAYREFEAWAERAWRSR